MIAAYLQLAAAMAVVGANIALGKAIVAVVPVFVFAAARFFIAIVILFPLARGIEGRTTAAISRGQWRDLFWQAFFGVFLFTAFMLHGVRLTSASSAGVITSTIPAVVAVLSVAMLGEAMSRRRAGAIALAVLGIAAINLGDASSFARHAAAPVPGGGAAALLGNALVLCAVVSEALFTIFAKKLSGKVPPITMAAWINAIGLALSLPLAWWQYSAFDIRRVSLVMALGLVYYALAASVISLMLWYRGIVRVPASLAGLFTGVMPISATLSATLFLGEAFSAAHALGLALVLTAIVIGSREKRKSPPLVG
ncbi:DMT family transporter [Varunaivibrio sulfuroxidans]|uniref:Threonine/homoserine efflux transporter RhtA n=1 Tax=Varunaivibrio sulfuroxidans TaxID=1773489 RepID=A0A4R3JJC8_9PROT|nr:DMT family transporter [Varunaivibrio sulfuroxidans]TCS64970.1 threonine/homoserine efflux transporter RhtA [Varunaivibrio sulfuroxidans]WES29738.1 DMT family transporter [Varunaivibrio sulfuroxidans]